MVIDEAVIVQGTSREELNGQTGVVSGWSEASGRYTVHFSATDSDLALKPMNLRLAAFEAIITKVGKRNTTATTIYHHLLPPTTTYQHDSPPATHQHRDAPTLTNHYPPPITKVDKRNSGGDEKGKEAAGKIRLHVKRAYGIGETVVNVSPSQSLFRYASVQRTSYSVHRHTVQRVTCNAQL